MQMGGDRVSEIVRVVETTAYHSVGKAEMRQLAWNLARGDPSTTVPSLGYYNT
jgi:hypothetical protein